MDSVTPYLLALVPTIGVGVLFYVVIKSILEGDRRERLAQATWEAEHDRRESAQQAAQRVAEKAGETSTEKSSAGPTEPSEGPSTANPVEKAL